MKIRSSRLKKIIKEEIEKVVDEGIIGTVAARAQQFGKETGIPEISDVAAQITRAPFKFFKTLLKKALFSPIKTAKLIAWILNDECRYNKPDCRERVIIRRIQKWLEEGGVDPAEEWVDFQAPSDAYANMINNHADELVQIVVDYYNEETGAGLTLESLRV